MTSLKRFIQTFVVFDCETNTLPQFNFNKVSLTELSIYAFAADELLRHKVHSVKHKNTIPDIPPKLPERPRVLHKLTLMINPRARIEPTASEVTGLDNFMLEHESPFNENTAKTLLGFLQHLQQPICLVAHNGNGFDFPILKRAIEKANATIPADMLCVDSLEAFWDIEEQRKLLNPIENQLANGSGDGDAVDDVAAKLENANDVAVAHTASLDLAKTVDSLISEADAIIQEFRRCNETTPKRRTTNDNAGAKRKRPRDDREEDQITPGAHIRPRALFTKQNPEENNDIPSQAARISWHRQKGFMPRNIYKLDNLYERIFKKPAENSHMAEYDVIMLMRLVLHFSEDFLSYAEQMAIPLNEVLPLGQKRR